MAKESRKIKVQDRKRKGRKRNHEGPENIK
jgi:hypothetical protein